MKIAKRILIILLTILFSTTITFFIIRLMPGDPVSNMAIGIHRSMGVSYEEAYEQAKAMLNYDPDEPIVDQYLAYVKQIFSGDLGTSIQNKASVKQIIGDVLPWTLLVSIISILLSFTLGTLIGLYCGWRRRSWINQVVTIYDSVTGSVPAFVIGYVLILIFSVKLRWFPMRGNYATGLTPGFNLAFIGSVLYHAVLPVMTWTLSTVGSWALGMRAMSVTVLGEDYIVSAKARGLSEGRILKNYVGRNAIMPQISSLAVQFGLMFAGSVLVENTFIYPGMGYFFSSAIANRDYPLMQGMFLIITIAVVITNQLAEVAYALIDPRVRKAGK